MQRQRKKSRQGDLKKNQGLIDLIRQGPRHVQGNTGICLTRQVCNSCIFPAMAYGAET